MDVRQLRYFVQVVESGSFLRASREIHIAQPALSKQIANLEAEIGVALLKRSSRGVAPTEQGRALYHHARFLLRQFEQVPAIARARRAELRGRVSVGMASTTLAAIGMELLRHVRKHHPGIVLNVVEALSTHVEQLIRLGRLDLAVLFAPLDTGEIRLEPLLEEELFVLVARDSEIVPPSRRRLTLAQAAALPLIVPTETHGLRRQLNIEFGRAGVRGNIVAEIDSLTLAMAAVREGLGAAIEPMAATLGHGSRPADWRVLSISDVALWRHNFLVSLPEDRVSPAAAAVRDSLREVVAQLVLRRAWPGVRLAAKA